MKKHSVTGVLLIIAGIACIFPFVRGVIFENFVVVLGFYLIYRGYMYLSGPTPGPKKADFDIR